MAGYSARQSTFTTGDTITAAHSNNEFNAILAAFHVSTGHKHDGSTAGDGGPISTLFSNAISMGTGADTDIALTFNANTNDGVLTWMEDQDYFQFSDDILISTTEKLQFRDTAIYINSSADGQLDLVADTEIQIAATTVDINGNVDISGSLTLGGTTITSTGAELNILDGVTSTAAELNILDGVTSTAAELNILDGVTSTTAELNILDGVTSTAAELNILDGVTSTAAELNILDGVTSTAAELNLLDGSTAGTVVASKAVVVDSDKDLTGIRNLTIAGDLTISGDDLTMATNTAGNLLIADGTNYNPTAVSSLGEISTVAGGDLLLAVDASGGGLKKITRSTLVAGLSAGTEISNVVEDTTPQLGGNLDSQGNSITDVGILGSSYGPTGTPTVITVTVASKTAAHPYYGDGSSSGYFLDGAESPAIDLHGADSVTSSSGYYYKFDQAEGTNSGHPLRFYLDAAKTIAYTTGVTTSGTPGTAGAHTTIAVTDQTPSTLYYQCSSHAYMGNYAGLNSAYIASSSAVTIDAVGDITLDADGGDIVFKDAGTTFGSATNTSGNLILKSGTTTALTFAGANATAAGNLAITGNLTVNGTTTTVNSTTVTIDDPVFTLGGDGTPGSDDNKDRGIEFKYHTGSAAKVGFFGYDDSAGAFTFVPDASNSSEVFSGTAGNVVFGNIAGTLTTAAQTNITSVGALDGGSITSNFGTINTGSSNITTTGTVSGGTLTGTLSTAAQTNITSLGTLSALTVDNIAINGTTIGHTDDTDLMTLASGGLTVAGTLEATGNITGTLATAAQTNITSTGALDGGSITSGFGAIDNGTSGIRTNTFTAETSIVPDASGGADLGSTSLEWGDLYIADDKKIYLGSDQNFSIEYDENGNDTTAVVAAGGVSLAPHGTSTGNGTELRFQELAANGANYVGFKSPDAIASNEVWVLPNADGTADQVLKTDGSNNLSWADGGGTTVDMVADGSISAGNTVALTSAGKVKATFAAGTASQLQGEFEINDGNRYSETMCKIGDTGKIVAFYRHNDDGDNRDLYYKVITVAANGTVSAGSEGKIVDTSGGYQGRTAAVYLPSIDRIFFKYNDDADSNKQKYCIGTLSGTSISWTSPALLLDKNTFQGEIFFSLENVGAISGTSTSDSNKGTGRICYIAIGTGGGSLGNGEDYGVATHVITVRGGTDNDVQNLPSNTNGDWESIISGTGGEIYQAQVGIDPENDKILFAYIDYDNSNHVKCLSFAYRHDANSGAGRVEKSSGSGAATLKSANCNLVGEQAESMGTNPIPYDSEDSKLLAVAFRNSNNDFECAGVSMVNRTLSTDPSATISASVINDNTVSYVTCGIGYNATAKKFMAVYENGDISNHLYSNEISFNGNSFAKGSDTALLGVSINNNTSFVIDTTTSMPSGNATPIIYKEEGSPQEQNMLVRSLSTDSNNLDFIGVSTNAVSNGETAKVAMLGSVDTNQSSLTIGTTYYLETNNNLETSASSSKALVGKAIAADKILVTGTGGASA